MFNTKISNYQILIVLLIALCFACLAQAATLSYSFPSTVNSGQTFSTTVRMIDSNGNPVPTASGSLTLTWDGPSGSLSGATSASFVNGVATFSNSITTSTTINNMLGVTYVNGGTTLSRSTSVTVTATKSSDATIVKIRPAFYICLILLIATFFF